MVCIEPCAIEQPIFSYLQQNCRTKQFKKFRFKISRWCNSVKLKLLYFLRWRQQTTRWDDDVIEIFTMKVCFKKIARLHVIARGNQFLYDETTLHVICRRSTIFINCITQGATKQSVKTKSEFVISNAAFKQVKFVSISFCSVLVFRFK